MNGRTLFLIAALSVSSLLAACGEDEPAPQKSSTLKLDGTYRPTQNGAIGSITFTNDKDYLLIPTGCSGGGCADVGTYRIDAEQSSVILVNAVTRETKTIKLEDVKTSEAAAMLIKTYVGTRDLVDPDQQLLNGRQQETNKGQQQVTGDQQKLNKDGSQQLAEQVSQLLKTVIEAMMNGQQMKQDEQDKKDQEQKEKDEQQKEEEKKKEECKQGVPTQDTPQAERDAYFARCPNGP